MPILLYNSTGARIDISNYSLRFGSVSQNYNFTSTVGNYIFNIPDDHVLEVGDCLLVGGPTSDDYNGAPDFDLTWNDSIYMGNGSNSAQGVALFNEAAQKIDVLIYGGETNNKIEHVGGSKTIDLPAANLVNGGSIKRTRTGAWEARSQQSLMPTQEKPKPIECPPF